VSRIQNHAVRAGGNGLMKAKDDQFDVGGHSAEGDLLAMGSDSIL
jgi:hypothetical protein